VCDSERRLSNTEGPALSSDPITVVCDSVLKIKPGEIIYVSVCVRVLSFGQHFQIRALWRSCVQVETSRVQYLSFYAKDAKATLKMLTFMYLVYTHTHTHTHIYIRACVCVCSNK